MRRRKPGSKSCRHCTWNAAEAGRRGLCKPCWKDKSIRHLYPIREEINYAKFSEADPEGRRPQAKWPINYPPGHRKKVELLARRRERGESLWHPKDAGWEKWEEGDCPESLKNRNVADFKRVGRTRADA